MLFMVVIGVLREDVKASSRVMKPSRVWPDKTT